ncbi:MAG TPA: ComF family protein [Firmicutes bacterium]|nr:ComF family protein [Bacillota bacterium]
MGSFLENVLFPQYCPLCGAKTSTESGLCSSCCDRLPFIGERSCIRCGRPLGYEGYCVSCVSSSRSEGWSIRRFLFRYDDIMAHLIHLMKYKGDRALLRFFARELGAFFERVYAVSPPAAVVPVPLSVKRERQRGFNQARELSRFLPLPVEQNYLKRVKNTKPQSVFSETAHRRKNVQEAFRASGDVKGRYLLLVDDIVTSGATAEEAAKTLKRAGAKRVDVMALCLARS